MVIMALNFVSLHPKPPPSFGLSSCLNYPQKRKNLLNLRYPAAVVSSFRTDAAQPQPQPEGTQAGRSTGKDPQTSSSGSLSSARTQLDLLEQLSSTISTVDGYESDGSSSQKLTIRDQLSQLVRDRDDDFSIPLGKNLKKVSPKFLTTSQKRNIRRQAYLDEVSQRNDTVFFATIGAFVILPPIIILGVAILNGYVQLFP